MDKAKRTEPPKKLCPQKISCFSPAGRLIGAGPPHSARSAACCEENASPSFCLRDSATATWLCTFGTHRPCGPELLQSTIRAQFPAGSCTHPFARLIHILLCAPRLLPGNKSYCTIKCRRPQGVFHRFAEKFAPPLGRTPCGGVWYGVRGAVFPRGRPGGLPFVPPGTGWGCAPPNGGGPVTALRPAKAAAKPAGQPAGRRFRRCQPGQRALRWALPAPA